MAPGSKIHVFKMPRALAALVGLGRCSVPLVMTSLCDAGIYMVEDTLTSYMPDHGGGYQKPETFLEYRCAPGLSTLRDEGTLA